MMKLGIFSNYGPPHCGGSEVVIDNVAQILSDTYGYQVSIYAFNYKKQSKQNRVKLVPCKKGSDIVSQINENDHIFIYSDSFFEWDTILQNIERIDCGVSVALVGAYYGQSNPLSVSIIKKHADKINLITHSKGTLDYKWCIHHDLPVKVIPNGVVLSEFAENKVDFKAKYNIKQKYMFLNVSNFFYGKGQRYLSDIGKKISGIIKDFIIVQISSSIDYPYDGRFRGYAMMFCNQARIRSMFLRDIPREDVVGAFRAADIFIAPSLKEVAPLVILEARAAKTPWVATAVGDVLGQGGGFPVNFKQFDRKGYGIINQDIIDHFACHIVQTLHVPMLRGIAIDEGQQGLEKRDWSKIVPLYDKEFNNDRD